MRGEAAFSTTYSEMSESDGNWYVDHKKYRSQLTCIIYGPGHSPYEYKVLGEFGTKYAKARPTRDRS